MLSGSGGFPALTLVQCCHSPRSLQLRIELLTVLVFGLVLFLGGYISGMDGTLRVLLPCSLAQCSVRIGIDLGTGRDGISKAIREA